MSSFFSPFVTFEYGVLVIKEVSYEGVKEGHVPNVVGMTAQIEITSYKTQSAAVKALDVAIKEATPFVAHSLREAREHVASHRFPGRPPIKQSAEPVLTEALIEYEANEFAARTGKHPTAMLIGRVAYLEFCDAMRPKHFPEALGVDIERAYIETLVLTGGPVKLIVDPDSVDRRMYLVSNEYSALNGGLNYG